MKKSLRFFILLPIALLVLPTTLSAQVPQFFNYQGIARDAGGNVLPNRKIGVELSVLDGGPAGTVVYAETFTDTTNAFGLFSMPVGGGTVVSGSFAAINWATGNKYLQTAIDLSGGTSYSLSGTTQLLSVPYALYAQNAVVGVSSGSWSLSGNASTADSNFIGTTNYSLLRFKTQDSISGVIDAFGQNASFGYRAFDQVYKGNSLGNSQFLGNVAVGNGALQNATGGNYNVAVGAAALFMTNGGSSGNGTGNVGVGYVTLQNNVAGSFNTAVGYGALQTNVSGTNNTAIGLEADMGSDGLTNATALGANAIVNASNMVQIGSTSVTTIQGQVPFTTPSDGRFKFNIREDVKGLDFILKLRPVTYQFNTKKQENFMRGGRGGGEGGRGDASGAYPAAYDEAMMVRRTGFIAQEVEKAAVSSGYDFDGLKIPRNEKEYYSLSYASFVVPLVKAVQEQEGVIRQQEQRIDDLTKQVKELRELILAATKK
jgi:hypothetical protein